eukprot:Phypoly_transcript_12846.p1 GENE.Phypoly_transcript_12846~~Phypoly_transcript_12846.p1  ORF type:complete len:275 (+),score=64.61 Phypoly_transcript_12846:70-894(+)
MTTTSPQRPLYQDHSDAFAEHEIFDAVGVNDVKRVRELLDCGVDINIQDFDKGWTPLHVAAARGAKQAMELLVQRGCDVNVQDNRGSTPLHSLIYKRYDNLALWLVKQGANIHQADRRGFSAYDNSLGWFQKELEDAAAGKDEKVEKVALTPAPAAPKQENITTPQEEVLKIYLKNNSYKSIKVTRDDSATDLARKMAAKLNMSESDRYFEVIEMIKDTQKYLAPGDNILRLRAKWPVIFGKAGNETHLHCKFLVVVKRGAPPEVHQMFDAASA